MNGVLTDTLEIVDIASRPAIEETPATPIETYRADFDALTRSNRAAPAWLTSFRETAMARFESVGFPTMRDENWHFTNVGPIAQRNFRPSETRSVIPRDAIARFTLGQSWPAMVFLNGRYSPELSDTQFPAGVSVQLLAAAIASDSSLLENHVGKVALTDGSAFTALNAAFARDGAVIQIAADSVADAPVHLIFLSDASAEGCVAHTRNLVLAGRNSQCTVIESYGSLGGESYFTNAVTEVFVGEGARLGHYKLQSESTSAFHVATIQARQERDSRYESFSFATGADLSRTNIYTTLNGNAAEVVLNGLYMVDGKQHVDHQTSIEHVAPNCPSHELYKGILDGRSHGVFNGKVYVHPEAQKTDGKQSNNNLLLSDGARVDTKPQLEIFADDVKCTHGATVGRLDDTALFYMRSRGVGMTQARRLLTYAFAADVLEKIELEPLKDALEAQVLARFTA